MVMDAFVVALSVILKPMQILEKAVDIICDDDAWSLGWRPF